MQAAGYVVGAVILSLLIAGCTGPSEPGPFEGGEPDPPRTSPAPDAEATDASNEADDEISPANPIPEPRPANEAHAEAMTLSDGSWAIDRFELYQAAGAHDKIRDKEERPNPRTPWLLVLEAHTEQDGERRFCWGWDDHYQCEWFTRSLKVHRPPPTDVMTWEQRSTSRVMDVGAHVVYAGEENISFVVQPVAGVGDTIDVAGMASVTLETYSYDTREGTLLVIPNGTAEYFFGSRSAWSTCDMGVIEEIPEGRRIPFQCGETSDGYQQILLNWHDGNTGRPVWAFRWEIAPE